MTIQKYIFQTQQNKIKAMHWKQIICIFICDQFYQQQTYQYWIKQVQHRVKQDCKLSKYKNNLSMSKPLVQPRYRAITQPNPEVKTHHRKKSDGQNFWPLGSPPKYQQITTPKKKKLNIQFLQYNLNMNYHFPIRQTALQHEQQELDINQENDSYQQITKKLQIALKRVLIKKKQKSLQQLDQKSITSNDKRVYISADPQVDKMLSRFQLLQKKRKENLEKKRQQILAQRLNKNLNRTVPVESFCYSTSQVSSQVTITENQLNINYGSSKQLKYTQYTYRPMISETAKNFIKKEEGYTSPRQWKQKHNRSATETAQSTKLSEDFTFKPAINDRSRKMIPRNRIPIYQRDKKPIYVQSTKATNSKQQPYFKATKLNK